MSADAPAWTQRERDLAKHLYENDGKHLAIQADDEVWALPFEDMPGARQEDYCGEARGIIRWLADEEVRTALAGPAHSEDRRSPMERRLDAERLAVVTRLREVDAKIDALLSDQMAAARKASEGPAAPRG